MVSSPSLRSRTSNSSFRSVTSITSQSSDIPRSTPPSRSVSPEPLDMMEQMWTNLNMPDQLAIYQQQKAELKASQLATKQEEWNEAAKRDIPQNKADQVEVFSPRTQYKQIRDGQLERGATLSEAKENAIGITKASLRRIKELAMRLVQDSQGQVTLMDKETLKAELQAGQKFWDVKGVLQRVKP